MRGKARTDDGAIVRTAAAIAREYLDPAFPFGIAGSTLSGVHHPIPSGAGRALDVVKATVSAFIGWDDTMGGIA